MPPSSSLPNLDFHDGLERAGEVENLSSDGIVRLRVRLLDEHDRWLARHPDVHFHFTPTHASWLNQVEVWFSILKRAALDGASHTSPRHVRAAIDRFVAAYDPNAVPFEWTKREVHQVDLSHTYADLRE